MDHPLARRILMTSFAMALGAATSGWSPAAHAQTTGPRCFVNGGTTYAGCVPAKMVFRIDLNPSDRIFDSLGAATMASMARTMANCSDDRLECKGIYRAPISYVGRLTYPATGACIDQTTSTGLLPKFSRSTMSGSRVKYTFSIYKQAWPGTVSCRKNGQTFAATRFETTGGQAVWGDPVCPASHQLILEFPDQWEGNFGYYCIPRDNQDLTTKKPKTSTAGATCIDGVRPVCAIAGNPVDVSAHNSWKVDQKTDLVVAGDFPIQWQRTYRSQARSGDVPDWQFPALKRLDWVNDPTDSTTWVTLQRGDDTQLTFQGTGTPGSRTWTPYWGNTGLGARYQVRSRLSEWMDNGQPLGFTLLNDRGEKEYYSLDGRLEKVENTHGRVHHYHYDTRGLLSEIEQEGGRSLYVTWAQSTPDVSGLVDYHEQDPADPGTSTPSQGAYSWYGGISSRSDLFHYPVVASVSDGEREVVYSWKQRFYADSAYEPRLSTVSFPDGRTWTYLHASPKTGPFTGVLDPEGKQVATYVYSGSELAEQWKGPGDGSVKADYLKFQSQQITDGLGNKYGYNSFGGRMKSYATDCPVCSGIKAKTFTYDSVLPHLNRSTDFNNIHTDYTYDSEGRVASITEAAGTALSRTRSFSWVPGYNLLQTEVEPGLAYGVVGTRTTAWTYDAHRRPVTKTVSAANGPGSTATRTWSYEYDGQGRPWKITAPDGRITELRHNAFGDLVARIEDPGTTGQRMWRWGGHRGDGLPRWTVSPQGVASVMEWDGSGRLLETQEAVVAGIPSNELLGATTWAPLLPSVGVRATNYTYNAAGLLGRVDHPDGTYTSLSYDLANRLTGTSLFGLNDALVSSTELTMDAMSNVTATTTRNGAGQIVMDQRAQYDSQYRVSKALNAAQDILWSQSFDHMHRPTTRVDSLGRTTANQYDALGRPLKHTDAMSQVFTLSYGPSDEVLTATDARAVQTTYSYNGFGELVEINSPDRGTWTFSYDAAGRRVAMTDPRGVAASYTYDSLSRPIQIEFSTSSVSGSPPGLSHGTVVHSFTYDICPQGAGRLCSVADATGTTAYAYNAWGEVVGKAWTGSQAHGSGITLSTGYGYDEDTGKLETVTFPSGKTLAVHYGWDGRPSALSYGSTPVATGIQWTAWDAVKGWHWPMSAGWSGTHSSVSFTYDLDGRAAAIEDIDEREMTWDSGNRLLAVEDPNDLSRSQIYGYDSLDRIVQADIGAWMAPQTYGYDAVGNRTSHTDDSTGNGWEYAYGLSHNRLTSRWPVVGSTPGTSFPSTYDAMGNLISDGMGLNLTYDATGRLVQGSKGPTTQTSGYNALGQRVSRAVVGGSQAGAQLYAYDEQGRPLGVYMPDSTEPNGFRVVEEYVHLDGWRPIAVVRPNATTGMANPDIHPILTDHLGTPRKVLDGNTGDVRWSWDAKEPFGHQAPNSMPTAGLPAFTFDLRFPGQRYDEATGLFQNGFRDYHAGLGRYVQSDPLGLEAGWNTYGYATSSPLIGTDPFGLDVFQDAFDYWQPPAFPQGVVDFSAGWGDKLSTIPFTDYSLTKKARQSLGTDGMVNCYSNAYSGGQATAMLHGTALGLWGGGAGFVSWGQRGVPAGMARVTTWGSQSIGPGSWVVMGSSNKINWVASGVFTRFKLSNSSTHIVPRISLKNPYHHRPENEPAGVAWGKNFVGINTVQKIYKP